jgi:hypothetical protein
VWCTAEIVIQIHWAGGAHTELRLPRRRRGQRNSTPAFEVWSEISGAAARA